MTDGPEALVEIKPEVVFLYEVLQELTTGRIQIPKFQRAYVWRRDQMTDLLDSVSRQYPVGSLLVWETSQKIATLDALGPFRPVSTPRSSVGYLLDGHQRLMTLAGALVRGSDGLRRDDAWNDNSTWDMFWNVRARRFQHRSTDSRDVLFPLTSLLDTLAFFDDIEDLRKRLPGEADLYIREISELARTFQSYRIPIIRIRQTGLSEAVEIFARLNSRGQAMTPDQMVSALAFQQTDSAVDFDLAAIIDDISEMLSGGHFSEIDRGTILRAILANMDEDIYRTDWTKIVAERRDALQDQLREAAERTTRSLALAVDFLRDLGVVTGRLLPYGLQLVLLSAFFDREPAPSDDQREVLSRWFWVSSFSAWFGGANPSRIGSLIREFRDELAVIGAPAALRNFDLESRALPLPTNFDMRSARTRAHLLVMLHAGPSDVGGAYSDFAWRQLAERGPSAVGSIVGAAIPEVRGNPANRMFRPPSRPSGSLSSWVQDLILLGEEQALAAAGIDEAAQAAAEEGDWTLFLSSRGAALEEMERQFQVARGVNPGPSGRALAPVDTE